MKIQCVSVHFTTYQSLFYKSKSQGSQWYSVNNTWRIHVPWHSWCLFTLFVVFSPYQVSVPYVDAFFFISPYVPVFIFVRNIWPYPSLWLHFHPPEVNLRLLISLKIILLSISFESRVLSSLNFSVSYRITPQGSELVILVDLGSVDPGWRSQGLRCPDPTPDLST